MLILCFVFIVAIVSFVVKCVILLQPVLFLGIALFRRSGVSCVMWSFEISSSPSLVEIVAFLVRIPDCSRSGLFARVFIGYSALPQVRFTRVYFVSARVYFVRYA